MKGKESHNLQMGNFCTDGLKYDQHIDHNSLPHSVNIPSCQLLQGARQETITHLLCPSFPVTSKSFHLYHHIQIAIKSIVKPVVGNLKFFSTMFRTGLHALQPQINQMERAGHLGSDQARQKLDRHACSQFPSESVYDFIRCLKVEWSFLLGRLSVKRFVPNILGLSAIKVKCPFCQVESWTCKFEPGSQLVFTANTLKC